MADTRRIGRSRQPAADAGRSSRIRRPPRTRALPAARTEEVWDPDATTRGVRFQTLRDRVIAILRSAIVLGYLEPGRLYPITWFEERLRMSRTPIREGLLDLISHGLVRAVRNRGYRIESLDDPDIDEIFRLRELLEVPAHAAAAERMHDGTARQLHDFLDDLQRAAASGDALAFVTADREFHLRIVGEGGSRWTKEFVSRLRDHVHIGGAVVDSLMRMNSQHVQLVAALERGDAARVREIVTRHLRATKDAWARRMRPGGPRPARDRRIDERKAVDLS